MNAETLCISVGHHTEAEMWIQLPCHLCAPQGVDLGGFGYFSQRNDRLKDLAQVNIVNPFRYDVKSVERHYINNTDR